MGEVGKMAGGAGTAGEDRAGFFARVYDAVDQIPCGMVATYGQIARLVGEPRKARFVGYALHGNPRPWVPGPADDPAGGSGTPCHRVVFADGRVCEGFAFGGPDAQRALLEAEGVPFRDATHVDLAACRWPAGA